MDSTQPDHVPKSVSHVDTGIVEKARENGIVNADITATRLSTPHRNYLLHRHGTLDLDPIPSMDPADPYNWPTWKVIYCLSFKPSANPGIIENTQPDPGSLSCLHGHLLRRRHQHCVRRHFRTIWSFYAAGELLDLFTDRYSRCRASLLEPFFQSIW